jgi:ABC-type phosphate transport system auxiliary subunit
MTVWAALILGLLIGRVVDQMIDRIGWQECMQSCTAELEILRMQHSRLRADVIADARSLARIRTELAALQIDNERLHDELNAANSLLLQYHVELGALNASFSAAPSNRATTV